MNKVFVLHKCAYESQSDTSDTIDIFEDIEDAKKEMRSLVSHVEESKFTENTETSIAYSSGNWFYNYYIDEIKIIPKSLDNESAIVKWARDELTLLEDTCKNDPDALKMQQTVNENLMDLVRCISSGGHSFMSAGYTIDMFRRLAMQKPVTPLTGADDEWDEVLDDRDGTQQNKRYFPLFRKNKDNSTAYDVESVIFSDDGGETWFGSAYLRKFYETPIEFPYYPPTEPRLVYVKWEDREKMEFTDITNDEDAKKKLREAARLRFKEVEQEFLNKQNNKE